MEMSSNHFTRLDLFMNFKNSDLVQGLVSHGRGAWSTYLHSAASIHSTKCSSSSTFLPTNAEMLSWIMDAGLSAHFSQRSCRVFQCREWLRKFKAQKRRKYKVGYIDLCVVTPHWPPLGSEWNSSCHGGYWTYLLEFSIILQCRHLLPNK